VLIYLSFSKLKKNESINEHSVALFNFYFFSFFFKVGSQHNVPEKILLGTSNSFFFFLLKPYYRKMSLLTRSGNQTGLVRLFFVFVYFPPSLTVLTKDLLASFM